MSTVGAHGTVTVDLWAVVSVLLAAGKPPMRTDAAPLVSASGPTQATWSARREAGNPPISVSSFPFATAPTPWEGQALASVRRAAGSPIAAEREFITTRPHPCERSAKVLEDVLASRTRPRPAVRTIVDGRPHRGR